MHLVKTILYLGTTLHLIKHKIIPMKNKAFLFFVLIVLVAAFSRIIPHPWNLTPVGAMAIFSAAYLGKNKWKYGIPLLAYWLSDLLVMNILYANYYQGFQWFGSLGVYIALATIILISAKIFKKKQSKQYLLWSIPAALASSIAFFLITNFASFLWNPIYPKNPTGLIASYTAGLPFFQNTLVSNVAYSIILFGIAALFERYYLRQIVQRHSTAL